MALTVISYDRETGLDPIPFDRFGNLAAVTYDHAWPGGCLTAQWTLDVPAHWSDRAATPGRLVNIYDGTQRVWRGQLTEPDRGAPWTFHAEGLQAALAGYVPLVPVSEEDLTDLVPSIDPNAVITACQGRGLPVYLPDVLPTPAITDTPSTVADLLNSIGQSAGQRWGVDRDGHAVMFADPTAVDYLYAAVDTFGRTPDGYATDIFIKYNDVDSGDVAYVEGASNPDDDAPRPFGRIEQVIDLTNQPPMTESQAQLVAAGSITLLGQHLNYTNSLTVTPGQLLSVGGVPVALSTVTAGQVMRLLGVQPETALGETSYTSGVAVVIGQISYDGQNLTITPLAAQRQDLTALVDNVYAGIPNSLGSQQA